MKKSRTICALGILAATFGSTAKAVPVNPANWDWSVVTHGARRDYGFLPRKDSLHGWFQGQNK